MKKILVSIAVGALAISSYAQSGPIYAPQLLIGGTSNVLAAATNTVGAVIDCRKQAGVALQVKAACDATNLGVVTYTLLKSVDGTSYETTGITFTTTMNGTNAVTIVTNIPTQGAGYLKLSTVANTNAVANLTNWSIYYGVKIQAP